MKLVMFLISSTKLIFTKMLSVSESSVEIKLGHIGHFLILLTSAVIYKQQFLYGNEIVQSRQNCKCYNIEQDHFRKPL